jgi:hypothetical protein
MLKACSKRFALLALAIGMFIQGPSQLPGEHTAYTGYATTNAITTSEVPL